MYKMKYNTFLFETEKEISLEIEMRYEFDGCQHLS